VIPIVAGVDGDCVSCVTGMSLLTGRDDEEGAGRGAIEAVFFWSGFSSGSEAGRFDAPATPAFTADAAAADFGCSC
jgi:hypothetical protein